MKLLNRSPKVCKRTRCCWDNSPGGGCGNIGACGCGAIPHAAHSELLSSFSDEAVRAHLAIKVKGR